MTHDIQQRYENILSSAKRVGQEHVLRFWADLDDDQQRRLLEQLETLDFEKIERLVNTQVLQAAAFKLPSDIRPAPLYPIQPKDDEQAELYRRAWQKGEELLRAGKVSAFTVAGGMGTRLGYDGPKGCYPISPAQGKTLFQLFAEYIIHCKRRYNRQIRWYIMTSRANHQATVDFFGENDFFELPEDHVVFFEQGMMPAFDCNGKLLLERCDSLALSPDGHGGSLRALRRAGALDQMKELGVEYISYFQVDNPLVRCLDPHFLGLHALAGSEMSSKSIPKAADKERVGNFVIGDGKLMVIEYSDFPDDLATAKKADGTRVHDSGSIAIHMLSRAFVDRITERDLQLPYHRAVKKVPFVDENGRPVEPDEPNAIKLEQFVFDAIPMADNPIVVQTVRSEEFSPVKNETGLDSVETARRDLSIRAANWLEQAGRVVQQDPDGLPAGAMEISPLTAIFPQDLKRR